MRVEWMMFANHAEERDGLLYLTGATWDTINVVGPMTGAPPGVIAAISGTLVIRLLFHLTETDRDHTFVISLMDEDGAELQNLEGGFHVARKPEHPPGWDQGVNIILGLTGMPLPRFGRYEFHLLIDGQHVAERPFRVTQGYSD